MGPCTYKINFFRLSSLSKSVAGISTTFKVALQRASNPLMAPPTVKPNRRSPSPPKSHGEPVAPANQVSGGMGPLVDGPETLDAPKNEQVLFNAPDLGLHYHRTPLFAESDAADRTKSTSALSNDIPSAANMSDEQYTRSVGPGPCRNFRDTRLASQESKGWAEAQAHARAQQLKEYAEERKLMEEADLEREPMKAYEGEVKCGTEGNEWAGVKARQAAETSFRSIEADGGEEATSLADDEDLFGEEIDNDSLEYGPTAPTAYGNDMPRTVSTVTEEQAPTVYGRSPTEAQLWEQGFEFHDALSEEEQIARFGDKASRKALKDVLPSLSRKQQWYAWRNASGSGPASMIKPQRLDACSRNEEVQLAKCHSYLGPPSLFGGEVPIGYMSGTPIDTPKDMPTLSNGTVPEAHHPNTSMDRFTGPKTQANITMSHQGPGDQGPRVGQSDSGTLPYDDLLGVAEPFSIPDAAEREQKNKRPEEIMHKRLDTVPPQARFALEQGRNLQGEKVKPFGTYLGAFPFNDEDLKGQMPREKTIYALLDGLSSGEVDEYSEEGKHATLQLIKLKAAALRDDGRAKAFKGRASKPANMLGEDDTSEYLGTVSSEELHEQLATGEKQIEELMKQRNDLLWEPEGSQPVAFTGRDELPERGLDNRTGLTSGALVCGDEKMTFTKPSDPGVSVVWTPDGASRSTETADADESSAHTTKSPKHLNEALPIPTIPGLGRLGRSPSPYRRFDESVRQSVEPETPHHQRHRESTPAFEDRSPSPSPQPPLVGDLDMSEAPPIDPSFPPSTKPPLPVPSPSPDPMTSPMHTAPQTPARQRSGSISRSPTKSPVKMPAPPASSSPLKQMKRSEKGRRKSAVQGSKVEKTWKGRATSRKVTSTVKTVEKAARDGVEGTKVKDAIAKIEMTVKRSEQETTPRRSARIRARKEQN